MANFLDLPLEIREQIYHHLLLYPPPDPSSPNCLLAPANATPALLHPSVLRVSKAIYTEALPILYAQNTFRSHTSSLLTSFPSLYDPGGAYPQISENTCPGVRLIRKWYLKARLDCGPFWTEDRVVGAFTGAEELTIELWQSMYGGGGGEILRLFRGVRGVKRVHIWGSTTGLERYVTWLETVMRSAVGTEVSPFDKEWPA